MTDRDSKTDSAGDASAAPTSRRRPFRDWLLFFGLWLRRPMKIANFAPSSQALARAMVGPVPDRPGRVVELGGGTGVFTEALLNSGKVAPDDLIVLEREKALFNLLRKRFAGCHVVQGDAGDLLEICRDHGDGPVKAVVSGLPILTMSEDLQTRIMGGAFSAMGDDGVFVQFTYMGKSPVKTEVTDALGLDTTLARKVTNNAPPARVYTYAKKPSG